MKHGPNTPGRAEDVEGLGEAVVVNQPSVYREHSHEQYNIASPDHDICNLRGERQLRLVKITSRKTLKDTNQSKKMV